jgi:uncharacterized Zn finger protein (UPF0148 family)
MTLPFQKYSNDPNFCGYPLFYIVEGECVCADCCNDAWENEEEPFMPLHNPSANNIVYNEEITEAVNYENKKLYCVNWDCGERIETVYKEAEIELENEFIQTFYREHGYHPEEAEIEEAIGGYDE